MVNASPRTVVSFGHVGVYCVLQRSILLRKTSIVCSQVFKKFLLVFFYRCTRFTIQPY